MPTRSLIYSTKQHKNATANASDHGAEKNHDTFIIVKGSKQQHNVSTTRDGDIYT